MRILKNNILILATAGIFASCTGQKGAARYFQEHPDKLAEICNDEFPAQPPVLIPGKSDTLYNVILQPGDSIEVPCPPRARDTVRVKAACPPVRIETRYITRVDTFQVDLSRFALAKANADIKRLKGEVVKRDTLIAADQQRHKGKWLVWWWLVVAVILAAAGWLYWRIKAGALNAVINKLKP